MWSIWIFKDTRILYHDIKLLLAAALIPPAISVKEQIYE